MELQEKEVKNLGIWSKKDFEALPTRDWNQDIGEFDSLIIIPTNHVNDSGFKIMDFISVLNDIPKYKISGCSDVVRINGIGGLGFNWFEKYKKVPKEVVPISWSIDCLKRSKLLRLFCNKKLRAGTASSSFEIYAVD